MSLPSDGSIIGEDVDPMQGAGVSRLADAFADALVRLGSPRTAPAPATLSNVAESSIEPAPSSEESLALCRLARRVWAGAAQGHSCIDLAPGDWPLDRAHPALTTDPAHRAAPLVIDGARVYLARLWQAETGLAARIAEFDRPMPLVDVEEQQTALQHVFGGIDPADAQQRAVLASLQRRLCVITGGPGTGKTTTLARLLVAQARLHPGLKVAYAAPTGKAAARLAQALAEAVRRLDPDGTLGRALPASGLTVHRLLSHQRGEVPLDALDLVIVDEASMLDLELAQALASRLGQQTRLVLAGDRDQLASVEAGAVFAALCEARLGGRVTLLHNWRQALAPAIAALAAGVRDGVVPPVGDPSDDLAFDERDVDSVLAHSLAGFRPAFKLVGDTPVADDAAARAIMVEFERFRVLCAQRGGPFGSLALNASLSRPLRPGSRLWYPGRLVMVVRNEASRQLFNGDVGVCLPWTERDGALAVAFINGDQVRWVMVSQMPPCEDAWAITIHKSQGSEFDAVVLVPAAPGHLLNTRELLYTGITRARLHLRVHAPRSTLAQAAQTPAGRRGGLAERIDRWQAGHG